MAWMSKQSLTTITTIMILLPWSKEIIVIFGFLSLSGVIIISKHIKVFAVYVFKSFETNDNIHLCIFRELLHLNQKYWYFNWKIAINWRIMCICAFPRIYIIHSCMGIVSIITNINILKCNLIAKLLTHYFIIVITVSIALPFMNTKIM